MDDVIVVGGRCAGAPTAMLLARTGLRVRLIERSQRLGDTVSGQVIQVAGVSRLRAWGVLDAVLATGCPRIVDGTFSADGQVIPMPGDDDQQRSPDAFLIAPARSALDPVLLAAAAASGVVVQRGESVRSLRTDGFRVTGVGTDKGEYPARLVVGADGRNSRVAKLVGATKYVDMVPATYSYLAFWADCPVQALASYWDNGYLTILIPTNDDRTLVYFQGPHADFDAARHDPMGNYLRVLNAQPGVPELLVGGRMVGPLRGTGDLPTFFRESAGIGWVLAGDAGHHKDPVMARGITDAFRDAELITETVATGWDGDLDQALAGYPARRDSCARPLASANDSIATGLGLVPGTMLVQAFHRLGLLAGQLDPPLAAVDGTAAGRADAEPAGHDLASC